MGIIRVAASVLLAICTPVFLVTTNLRILTLSPAYYDFGHTKYDVAKAMGVTPEQTRAVSAAVIDYLQSTPDSLPSLLAKHGASPTFFSQRDMLHLSDVYGLVQMVFAAEWISLVLILLCKLGVVLLHRTHRDTKVVSGLFWGGIVTVVALGIIAIVSFTNFDSVFLQFHYFAFTNDYWRLDPQVDRLILMFPPYFFYDMMLLASALTLIEAIAIAVVAGAYVLRKSRFARRVAR